MDSVDTRMVLRVTAFEDLVDRIGRFESFTIAGRVYSADLLIPQLTIDAKDLITETQSAAAFALFWGIEAARARRFKAQVEASYRMWRDRIFLETKSTPNANTGKPPTDSQAESAYRMDPDYGMWRSKADDAQLQAELAEAIYEAFKIKKDLVKSAQEILRTEAGGTAYVVVEEPVRAVGRQPHTEG